MLFMPWKTVARIFSIFDAEDAVGLHGGSLFEPARRQTAWTFKAGLYSKREGPYVRRNTYMASLGTMRKGS